ncbi:BTAD domain-containing putative transcriptional regulator [Micromonospora profundi]|uniref:AfsR/SARP family transcriptional regulator n=1 Tax=Micromonospora profundi TaxID=1420889 RepID=UPI0033A8DB12
MLSIIVNLDLLGPLRVSRDGVEVPLPSVKQRLLLAGLLLRPNEVVGTDELLAVLWSDEPPASATANLRTYVHGLRRALGPSGRERITATAGGYLIRLSPGERDLDRFDAAVARGRASLAASEPEQAAMHLADALDMWRGAPLSDLPHTPLLARRIRRLVERRLLAEEDHAAARLAAGAAAGVIERLRALVDQHPLRQRAWAHLMTALYYTGDVSGALDAFQQARGALAEQTGLDPGPELVRLRDGILHHRLASGGPGPTIGGPAAGNPTAGGPAAGNPTAGGPVTGDPAARQRDDRRPAQLPLALPRFIGREPELSRLDHWLDDGTTGPTTVVISAVSGMAGVGKTALALRWAHRVADRFPDGQLYLNLRGYDDVDAVSAAEALRSFLETLGVPDARIPTTTDARIGLYRSLLATRRMLIVLDNARDSDQVRPLLPGTGFCAVVITSRDQLNGLIRVEGAKPLTLNVLTEQESRTLLGNWLGAGRIAGEPAAVARIIDAAGRLPLAMSIVAARMAANPTLPLTAFAAELRRHEALLDALDDGDVRRVFSWSYRALSERAAELFRLLGLHPGPDLTAGVAAALSGQTPAAVMAPLRELTRLHLLTEHQPGRYVLHDLLRTYAAELAASGTRDDHRRAAYQRLYDHYLHQAYPAARLLQPQWAPIPPVPRLPDSLATPLADRQAALDWFAAERRVLVRVVRQAADTGFGAYAWQLAWALTAFLAPHGLWQDQLTVQQIAAAAAETAGDLGGQAMANRMLARAALRLNRHDVAARRLEYALKLYERIGDLTGQAQTLHSRTELAYEVGKPQDALVYGRQALRLHRLANSAAGEGRTLNAIGYIYATTGEYELAIASCTEALALQEKIDDRNGQAATLDSLGFVHERLGAHERAADLYERSIRLFRDSADRYHEAETLVRLGDVRATMGDLAAAGEAWRRATEIYDSLGDPAADDTRSRLDRLDGK